MFKHAISRKPGGDLGLGLTTSNLGRPDFALASKQHAVYVDALRSLGLDVVVLDSLAGCPDAYFVEDAAVVTRDVAVITRPGAASRRGETDSIEAALATFRETMRIEAPGTLDGGDVLAVGDHFFIGLSERTNEGGASQLGRILERYGATWQAVPFAAGLHLKSSVNTLGGKALLVTRDFDGHELFADYDRIVVDEAEQYAANVLCIGDTVIIPAGFPSTRRKVESLGRDIVELDVSEMEKMDGGLTCMSLRF